MARYENAVESQPVPNIDHLLNNIGRTASTQGEVSGNVFPGPDRLCGGGSTFYYFSLLTTVSVTGETNVF